MRGNARSDRVPPAWEDLESSQVARLADTMFVAAFLASVMGMATNLGSGWHREALALSIMALSCVVGLFLNRRGHGVASAAILFLSITSVLAFLLFNGIGLFDSVILAYPILILVSAFIFRKGGLRAGVTVSVLSVIGIYVLETTGIFEARYPATWMRALMVSVLFVAFALIVSMIRKTWYKNLASLREREGLIVAQLDEKETLLKELYHRTCNNMQLISSMIGLEFLRPSPGNLEESVAKTDARIQTISLALEMLYGSKVLGKVDSGEFIRCIVSSAIAATALPSPRIECSVDVESIPLQVDTAVPLGLVVNELVGNACIHAFTDRDSGRLEVALRREEGGRLRLSIADDGRGLPPSFLPSRDGRVGIQVVHALCTQLGGTVEYSSGPSLTCTVGFVDPSRGPGAEGRTPDPPASIDSLPP